VELMAKYTTGEIAKLCGVSVRTVQYYDNRKILVPSELSEGGRRLYDDKDLAKMKILCYLKDLGLSLDNIAKIMLEDNSTHVISLILDEQKKSLENEIKTKQDSLNKLDRLQKVLKYNDDFDISNIENIRIIDNKKKLNRLHISLIFLGLPITIFQWVSIILWITKGLWWLFVIYLALALLYGIFLGRYYFKKTVYKCPECHSFFKPSFKEAFFAKHTPKTRKLICPHCNYHGYCVEMYDDKNSK
jgi:DNA-binding transcriptional MerR regulator/DNA-directed RNA polymerase subunit RPC12/RpoP